jgi:hypothetical protein
LLHVIANVLEKMLSSEKEATRGWRKLTSFKSGGKSVYYQLKYSQTAQRVNLCVLYGFQSKQRLFPSMALAGL